MVTRIQDTSTLYDKAEMASPHVISLVDEQATLMIAGGKGVSLARLARAGLPVPEAFFVTTTAYRTFIEVNNLQAGILRELESVDASQPGTLESASISIQDLILEATMPADIADTIAQAYEELPGINPAVAVRSSATAEDLPGLSFAGQQESFLNIQGIPALLEAVQRCWASLWTSRAIGYRARHNIDSNVLSLAVVVQLMVPAEAAGILFTANPVTGRRDQVVINATWGLGEAIVGGQVTPDTIIISKETRRIIERETADKTVMTVGLNGGTQTRPVPDDKRRAIVVDDDKAVELLRLSLEIEALYAYPMDVEWALAGGEVAILQARPITALPEPEAPPPADWQRPDPDGQYLRTSIIDFMPNPLSPLFGSMGLPAVNRGLHRLIRYWTRSEPRFPEETIILINDYTYMQANFTRREWFWILTRLLPAFPRMMRKGIDVWRDEVRPEYVNVIDRWQNIPLDSEPATKLYAGAVEITEAAADHLGSLMVGTMGVSAGTEGLFTNVYDKLIKQEGDPWAPAYLMGYDSIPIQAEKSLFDLSGFCRESDELAKIVREMPSDEVVRLLRSEQLAAGVDAGTWSAFKEKFNNHLQRFGHIIYDLDFASPLPVDDPAPMVETCKMYLRGKGSNPYERQRKLAEKREKSVEEVFKRVKGLRRWLFRKTLGWAQTRAEVREDGIADIGLGYPLLRTILLELGDRFVQAGCMEKADDVYWLLGDELKAGVLALDGGRSPESMFDRIAQRKAVWRAEKRVTPPPKLGVGEKYLGMSADTWLAAQEDSQAGSVLKGLGASPGRVTAAACVLHGPEDFDRMQPGEVLVATITTPAWTPLFAMASAVVTDVGGPLSHGSIVAREYGIPAVLGTGVATKLIIDGEVITVDGDAGMVLLPNGQAEA